jgi:ribosomal protein S18 acetylase RimI-like enzyme
MACISVFGYLKKKIISLNLNKFMLMKKHHRKRRLSQSSALSDEIIIVRSLKAEDQKEVMRICYNYFRSLCGAAVKYYCFAHFRDLVALVIISKLFQSWKEVGIASFLFILYLFIRARIEMELYILFECPDLRDIEGYYMSDSRGHFWVAESHHHRRASGTVSTTDSSCVKTMSGSEESSCKSPGIICVKEVLGCVGCAPVRDDETVVQLLRLVVKEEARRMRHGSRLLAQFENFAKQNNYKQVRLYTNNLSSSHMKFIRQHGYVAYQTVPRSLMRGSLIEWKKKLQEPCAVGSYFTDSTCNPLKSNLQTSNVDDAVPLYLRKSLGFSTNAYDENRHNRVSSRITTLQD